jgi:hypothetical protein
LIAISRQGARKPARSPAAFHYRRHIPPFVLQAHLAGAIRAHWGVETAIIIRVTLPSMKTPPGTASIPASSLAYAVLAPIRRIK